MSKNVRRDAALTGNAGDASGSSGMIEVDREPIFLSVMYKWLEEEMVLTRAFKRFKRRGPTRSSYIELHIPLEVRVGFHRLSIMDPTAKGDQPFVLTFQTDCDGRPLNSRGVTSDASEIAHCRHTIYVVCNGEIYNYKELINSNIPTNYHTSKCDREVLPHLYTKFGIKELVREISGEIALIIVDVDEVGHSVTVHAARDPVGVKPLFWANDERGLALCSELKGLVDVVRHPLPFPPGSIMSARFTITDQTTLAEPEISWDKYYSCEYPVAPLEPTFLPQIYARIREILSDCVRERLMSDDSDRPISFGALLSGGLDSSLVAAIAARELKKQSPDNRLQTFTIGMPGSTDLEYAQLVANHISSNHQVVELQAEDFLNAIPEVVYATETYDITTVRASTGQFLISKYISTNTDIKVWQWTIIDPHIFNSTKFKLNKFNTTKFNTTIECLI